MIKKKKEKGYSGVSWKSLLLYVNTKFHRNMFIQELVVYCAFCLSSIDEIVPLTIIKAGRALKFFPLIIIYLYFKLL